MADPTKPDRILHVRCHTDHVTVRCTGHGAQLSYSDDRGKTWHPLRLLAGQAKRWRMWTAPADPDTIIEFEYTDRTITIGRERRYRARLGRHHETASVVIH